jgi:hypothetical protein
MGVVFKARQVALNRVVALKMILPGVHPGGDERARFRREAEAVARLQHPNVVQVFEVGEHHGQPFFSLEFCPGGSLGQKLQGTPLRNREAAALVQTLAEAVHAAHEAGVVHRDLKPANVLLAQSTSAGKERPAAEGLATGQAAEPRLAGWVPKISDFGLAKNLDDEGRTQTGTILGTASYMAPEQAGGRSKEVGPACDVYALGAVLYDCLTGRPPFKAATFFDTVQQVLSQEPVPPARLNAKVHPDLNIICLKCLQKDPRRRYRTAQDLADDLGRWLAGEPIRARRVGVMGRAVKWARRKPAVAALLATVLLLVVGGTLVTGYILRQNWKMDETRAESLLQLVGSPAGEEALLDLAATPSGRVRRHFLRRALGTPEGAGRLADRAGMVMRALVGLDRGRRGEAQAVLKTKLADSETPPEQRAYVGALGAALGPDDPAFLGALVDPITEGKLAGPGGFGDTKAEYRRRLSRILRGLSSQLSPGAAVPALLDAMNQTSDEGALQAFAYCLRAMSSVLPEGQAVRAIQTLLAIMTGTPSTSSEFRVCFHEVSKQLPADQAGEAAKAVVAALEKVTQPGARAQPTARVELAGCLQDVCDRLPRDQAGQYAARGACVLISSWDRIRKEPGGGPFNVETDRLARALASISGHLPAEQAGPIARMLHEEMGKAKLSPPDAHVGCWRAVTTRLPVDQAARALLDELDGSNKTPKSKRFQAAAAGLRDVSPRLPAAEAARVAETLLDLLTRLNKDQWGYDWEARVQLTSCLQAVAARLPADQAGRFARRAAQALLDAWGRERRPGSVRKPFMKALRSVSGQLPADDFTRVVEALLAAVPPSTPGKAFPRLLRPEQAAEALLNGLKRETDVSTLVDLVGCLQDLCKRLPREQAKRLTEQAAQALIPRVEMAAWRPADLPVLARCLCAVNSQSPAGQAAAYADLPVEKVAATMRQIEHPERGGMPDSSQALVLVMLLKELGGQMTPGAARRHASWVAESVFEDLKPPARQLQQLLLFSEDRLKPPTHAAEILLTLSDHVGQDLAREYAKRVVQTVVLGPPGDSPQDDRWQDPLRSLLRQAVSRSSTQGLVEGLKSPLCVYQSQRIILDELGRRAGQKFASVWDYADWAERHAPEIDLRSPPRRRGT